MKRDLFAEDSAHERMELMRREHGWRFCLVWLAVILGSWIAVAGIVVWVMALAKAMQ